MPPFQSLGARLAKLTNVGALALFALYPLLVYLGLKYSSGVWIAGLLIALCLLRLLFGGPFGRVQVAVVCVGGVLLAVVSIVKHSPNLVLYYPVMVNGALLFLFAYSLVSPPTIIERLARLRDPDLSAKGVAYTRRVTLVWVVFFLCNGSAAFYTALSTSPETWAFYNGVVAYVLMGIVFGVEFLVRMRVMRRSAQ
jgi:uncharacterized membrane protein